MADDYDSPWKEALDFYFQAFVALLFPEIYVQIDWARGFEFLDKEFQQVVREAEIGRRYVDKLVKIWTIEGTECWVLIHVEVQTARDPAFPKRMYVYHYRIFDRYDRPVASVAVLADDDPKWRPTEFRQNLFGCDAGIRFPTVKLLNFLAREAELEASDNPFAFMVLAHLKTQQTQGDPVCRQASKIRLVRSLFERGLKAKDLREMFRLIDWLMVLPPPLITGFLDEVDKIQKEKIMPYVSSSESVGLARGLKKGIAAVLRVRFGEAGLKLMTDDLNNYEDDQLEAILKALETAENLDEVRRILSRATS